MSYPITSVREIDNKEWTIKGSEIDKYKIVSKFGYVPMTYIVNSDKSIESVTITNHYAYFERIRG